MCPAARFDRTNTHQELALLLPKNRDGNKEVRLGSRLNLDLNLRMRRLPHRPAKKLKHHSSIPGPVATSFDSGFALL